jgi:hypothetical protein
MDPDVSLAEVAVPSQLYGSHRVATNRARHCCRRRWNRGDRDGCGNGCRNNRGSQNWSRLVEKDEKDWEKNEQSKYSEYDPWPNSETSLSTGSNCKVDNHVPRYTAPSSLNSYYV